MFFDRLDHVLGATRTKTALAHEQRTDRSLVESHQRNQDRCEQATHCDDSPKINSRKIPTRKSTCLPLGNKPLGHQHEDILEGRIFVAEGPHLNPPVDELFHQIR